MNADTDTFHALAVENEASSARGLLHLRPSRWLLIGLAVAALGAVTWAGLTPIRAELREEVHAIPKGTWARRMSGDYVEILPSEIRLTMDVKDILVLINNDDVPQLFGPVLMMPGQSFKLPFNVASEYQFVCTAHTSGFLTVKVDPVPEWWKLLQLRLKNNLNPAAWSMEAEQRESKRVESGGSPS